METSEHAIPPPGMRPLFASADFVRLWAIGGVGNAMRFVELLAAGLFVYHLTGSGLAVAIVSAARTLPMLLFGAVAGVVCEAVDRKTVLQGGLLVSAASSSAVFGLALAGVVQPWHVGLAAFCSGCVWATEMATRRRMVGEAAGPALVSRAVALDSMTGALTRGAGPLIGSFAFDFLGLAGAYAISAGAYLAAAGLVPAIRHTQVTKPMRLSRVPRDLAEGFAFARRQPTVLAVLGVTVTMNLFAFSYSAAIAPIAQGVFGQSAALAGVLASAEPLGSLLGGLILANITPKSPPRVLMLGGSAAFLMALALMPMIPNYWLACLVLTIGGMGLALFGNMQTTLILTNVPQAVRSRMMGLITVSIGTGPLGQLLIGALGVRLGELGAVLTVACGGLVCLSVVALLWTLADGRRGEGRE